MARKNPLNTPETREIILKRLANGETLRAICRDLGIAHNVVVDWRNQDPVFDDHYARAIATGYDAEADQIVDLSQRPYSLVPNKSGALVIDPGEVAARRLETDTRKWVLARRAPKKYGDRVQTEISGPEGGPVCVVALPGVAETSEKWEQMAKESKDGRS